MKIAKTSVCRCPLEKVFLWNSSYDYGFFHGFLHSLFFTGFTRFFINEFFFEKLKTSLKACFYIIL